MGKCNLAGVDGEEEGGGDGKRQQETKSEVRERERENWATSPLLPFVFTHIW